MRLLVVDDTGTLAPGLRQKLRTPHGTELAGTVEAATSTAAALACLDRGRHDVVLLHLGATCADGWGLDLLDALSRRSAAPPVVVATSDELTGLEAIRHGAQDALDVRLMSDRAIVRALRRALERHLAHARLRADAGFLDEVDSHLRDFTVALSHDLRRPVGVAKAAIETVARLAGEALGPAARLLEIADDQLGRIVEQADGLLDELRPGGPPPAGAVSLADSVAWAQATLDHPSLRITHGELPPVHARDAAVRQILQNVLHNAVSHNGHQPLTHVHIEAEQRVDEMIDLVISDDGIGVTEDRLSVIFDPGVTSSEHGTGIGLATVRRVARELNGDAWMDPAGRLGGATVVVRLPAES